MRNTQAEFKAEIRAAERYERGLLFKTCLCLFIVVAIGVLRQTFLV